MKAKSQYSDDQIIEGMARGHQKVLNYIYSEFFSMVERMVINKGGTTEASWDIFQEAMEILMRKINDGDLSLTCSFSTYLYAICKNLWYHSLRKYRETGIDKLPEHYLVSEPEQDEPEMEKQQALFKHHFKQLSKDCQKLLSLAFQKVSLNDIMEIMGYSSEHYTADRKYKCKKSLISRIRSDPEFKRISDGLY